MKNNSIYVALIVVALVAIGGYFYPTTSKLIGGVGLVSPQGSSNNNSAVAQQNLSVSSPIIYSQLNTDATDRTILSSDIFIEGANSTTTSTQIQCATSTSGTATSTNTNFLLNMTLSNTTGSIFGTTTGSGLWMSSSSPGITGSTTVQSVPSTINPFARKWAAGSYLVCGVYTGDTTNTFSSTTDGFIRFPYAKN